VVPFESTAGGKRCTHGKAIRFHDMASLLESAGAHSSLANHEVHWRVSGSHICANPAKLKTWTALAPMLHYEHGPANKQGAHK
jgi:hypothetical protein